jgi:hypothetical protein
MVGRLQTSKALHFHLQVPFGRAKEKGPLGWPFVCSLLQSLSDECLIRLPPLR